MKKSSEKTAEVVDAEIRSWLDAAHTDAKKILSQNRAIVEKLANELLKRETLTGDEIREIIVGKKSSTKRTAKVAKQKRKVVKK